MKKTLHSWRTLPPLWLWGIPKAAKRGGRVLLGPKAEHQGTQTGTNLLWLVENCIIWLGRLSLLPAPLLNSFHFMGDWHLNYWCNANLRLWESLLCSPLKMGGCVLLRVLLGELLTHPRCWHFGGVADQNGVFKCWGSTGLGGARPTGLDRLDRLFVVSTNLLKLIISSIGDEEWELVKKFAWRASHLTLHLLWQENRDTSLGFKDLTEFPLLLHRENCNMKSRYCMWGSWLFGSRRTSEQTLIY